MPRIVVVVWLNLRLISPMRGKELRPQVESAFVRVAKKAENGIHQNTRRTDQQMFGIRTLRRETGRVRFTIRFTYDGTKRRKKGTEKRQAKLRFTET
jgi:hypothetical protein